MIDRRGFIAGALPGAGSAQLSVEVSTDRRLYLTIPAYSVIRVCDRNGKEIVTWNNDRDEPQTVWINVQAGHLYSIEGENA